MKHGIIHTYSCKIISPFVVLLCIDFDRTRRVNGVPCLGVKQPWSARSLKNEQDLLDAFESIEGQVK